MSPSLFTTGSLQPTISESWVTSALMVLVVVVVVVVSLSVEGNPRVLVLRVLLEDDARLSVVDADSRDESMRLDDDELLLLLLVVVDEDDDDEGSLEVMVCSYRW